MLQIRSFEPWTYFEECYEDEDDDDEDDDDDDDEDDDDDDEDDDDDGDDDDDDDDDDDVDINHSQKEKNHHDQWQCSNSATHDQLVFVSFLATHALTRHYAYHQTRIIVSCVDSLSLVPRRPDGQSERSSI